MPLTRNAISGFIAVLLLLTGCNTVKSTDADYMTLYEQANSAGQDDLALEYLKLAEIDGNRNAMVRLGEAYWHGRYGLNDPEKGFAYIQKAALQGEARAMTDLGIQYLYGEGVEQNYSLAREWLEKADYAGDMKASRYIGLIYENGWGDEVNYTEAAVNYQKAADKGDITSQYYLGKLYENGLGVVQDYAKALVLYKQSATRGDIISLPAILALGNIYEQGLGVTQDISIALDWYSKAAALGDGGAKLKIGKYQYPNTPYIMNVTALVKVIGDGQKIAGLAIEYTADVILQSLTVNDFNVAGREITSVYLSQSAILGQPSTTGSVVIIELKTDIDPTSSQMGGGPQKEGNASQEAGTNKTPGTGGPQLGQVSDKSADPVILTATITQTGEISLASGETATASGTVLTNNITLSPDTEGFQQHVYHDIKFNKDLMYNLFVPKNYDPAKSYPLVLFMHDAGVVSNNPTETLTQGLGSVIWASERDQALHESFVLAPQYNAIMADDNSKTSDDMDVTVNLLKDLMTRYSIDANRLYNTGQSMGGMTSIAMDIKYPDLFAASLLVACQWDPKQVTPLSGKPLWIVVSQGDTKANPGMDAITAVLADNGATVAKATWNAEAAPNKLDKNVRDMLSQNASVNYTIFTGGSHRYTWQYAYSIDGIRDWLFNQHK